MMVKGYKIGLFFVCAMIMVLAAVLFWKRNMGVFPDKDIRNGTDMTGTGDIILDMDKQGSGEYEQDLAAQNVNIVTTYDTVCVYENIDKKDGAVSTEEGKLPEKYVGLTRKQLEEALLEDSGALTLEDRQKGFKSQHLELFSPDKIKVLRIYDTSGEQTGFYIMEVGGEIGVYRQDRQTLYFKTGLNPQSLPPDVLDEVREGKFMESEIQVYYFLESYSS